MNNKSTEDQFLMTGLSDFVKCLLTLSNCSQATYYYNSLALSTPLREAKAIKGNSEEKSRVGPT